MESWLISQQWLQDALAGMASPWMVGIALVLTSYLLEDVAIAAGASLAAQGTVSWVFAFMWVAGGIASGDIGLYLAGLAARRVPWLRRKFIEPQRHHGVRLRLEQNLGSAILLARVVPGLRLVTYTVCGFVRLPLAGFSLWVALAVALWTVGLFWLGVFVGEAFTQIFHLPPSLAVPLPIIGVAIAVPLIKHLRQRRKTTAP